MQIVDLDQERELRSIESGRNWKCIAGDRSGTLIVAGSECGVVAAWDGRTGKKRNEWKVADVRMDDVEVIDDRHIAWLSWKQDDGVTIFDTQTEEKRFLKAKGCERMAVSECGQRLAVIIDGNDILLWDLTTDGKPLKLSRHRSTVIDVAFDPKANRLYSVSNDRALITWDVATGEHVRTRVAHLSDVDCLAVSPQGRTLITSARRHQGVRLWNASTGQQLFDVPLSGRIVDVTCDAKGTFMACLGDDDTIEICRTSSKEGITFAQLDGLNISKD